MTVTPVMGQVDAATLPPPMLDSKLSSLLRVCRDGPKEQVRLTMTFFLGGAKDFFCCVEGGDALHALLLSVSHGAWRKRR